MNFSTSVKVESVLRLNTKVEAYEILHMLTKIQNFSTLELRDMEFLVILCLLSNNPDSKAISEFSGMVASALSLKGSQVPAADGQGERRRGQGKHERGRKREKKLGNLTKNHQPGRRATRDRCGSAAPCSAPS
jgi:hypothetical protein